MRLLFRRVPTGSHELSFLKIMRQIMVNAFRQFLENYQNYYTGGYYGLWNQTPEPHGNSPHHRVANRFSFAL